MKIHNIYIEDFPLLFGPAGLYKDDVEQFVKTLKQLDLLNEEATELQKETADISDKAKWWLEKDLSVESVNYYSKGIKELYPTKTLPEDQTFDITYQDRYAIGQQFVFERKSCNEKIQECLEMFYWFDRL